MPEMDGYEATAEIRRQEGSVRYTPIVAMTANALQGDREKCLAAGMDDYVSKPVRPEELQAVLERLLEQPATDHQPNSTITLEDSPPVDLKQLHQAMGYEPEELREILDIYLDQMPLNLENLGIAIESGNAEEVNLIAHNCAGTSANCGMSAVVSPFRELERMGREKDLARAMVVRDQACVEFERVKLFLAQHLQPVAA
jgi:HPt (histidine-containing phosphotransfer) domain-containing protein